MKWVLGVAYRHIHKLRAMFHFAIGAGWVFPCSWSDGTHRGAHGDCFFETPLDILTGSASSSGIIHDGITSYSLNVKKHLHTCHLHITYLHSYALCIYIWWFSISASMGFSVSKRCCSPRWTTRCRGRIHPCRPGCQRPPAFFTCSLSFFSW